MRRIRSLCLLLVIVMIVGSVAACGDHAETGVSETNLLETNAPETDAPETDAPETDAPETDAPETDATETEPAVAYDPIKATFIAAADTYVQMNSTEDFGAAETLMVKKADAKGLTRNTLVRFDLSGLEISTIENVTLRFYCIYANDTKAEIQGRDYKLYAVASDWAEMGMTWDTQPEAGVKVTDIDTTSAAKDKWIEVDITEYVKTTFTRYVSFVICNEGPDSENNHINMGSREVAGQEPQLVIEGKLEEGKALTLIENAAPPKTDDPVVEESETVAVLPSVADTYVQMNSTEDFGAAEKLMVKSAETSKFSRRAFVRFDLSELKISEINKVTLRLYCQLSSTLPSEIKSRDYKLYAVSDDWNEIGMTWDTQPTVGVKVADIDTTAAKKGVWVEVDVTEYVKENLYSTLSFVICNEGVETDENHINFGSREAQGQEPQLVFDGKYEEGKELPVSDPIQPEAPVPEACEHKAYLKILKPTATESGYIMCICYICDELLGYQLLSADPTIPQVVTTTLTAKADAYVQKNTGTTNYGGENTLKVKTDSAGKLTRQVLLTFNTLTAEADEVDSVILRLYCTFASNNSADKTNRNYKLYAISTDWEEQSVTWDTQPAAGVKIVDADARIAANNKWLEIDVTDYVKAHLGETISFLLLNESVDTAEGHLQFASREAGDEYAPQLFFKGTYDPETAKPVEPRQTTLNPTADIHVQRGKSSSFNATDLEVKSDNNGNVARRAYLLFDATQPELADATVQSVVLRLYCTYANSTDKNNRKEYKLYATSADAGWSEETNYTFDVPPVTDDVCIATIDLSGLPNITKEENGRWFEVDVTEYVENNVGKQITFSLRNEGAGSNENQIKVSSMVAANKPQLVIDYLPAAGN